MSTYISARLGLTQDAPLPRCYMGGTDKTIPVVEWADGDDFYVSLKLLDDPATYLREWAHSLNALAAEVDAAADQRAPSGYVAPVVAGGAS